MTTDAIVRGRAGWPVYGKHDTLIYAAALTMSCHIVISWEGGSDVDICAFFTHYPSVMVGYAHDGYINDGNGLTAAWGGDNTTGGPETVDLAYSGWDSLLGKSFEIHANWYSVGTDSEGNELSGGGSATITATDQRGNTKTFTLMPATNKHKKAEAGDPGAIIIFDYDGSIKQIAAA